MKTLKKLTALILAIVMTVALCSCAYDTQVKFKKNGKAKVKLVYTFTEQEAREIETAIEDESAFDSTIQASNDQGLTKVVDGVTYYSYVVESDSSVEDMNAELATPGNYSTTDFWTYSDQAESLGTDEEYGSILEATGIELTLSMSITLPYKITETNCKQIDDYTVYFDTSFDGNYVYAVTEASTASWTKSKNKVAQFKRMAIKQTTPSQVKGVDVNYNNAKTLRVSFTYLDSAFVNGYKIERKVGNGKFKEIKNVDVLSANYDDLGKIYIVDRDVKAGKTYSYRVCGYHISDNGIYYGVYSATKSIKFANFTKKPTFTIKVNGRKATVKIKNFDKAVDGYQIKYSTDKNFKGAKTVTTKKATATINGLNPAKTYYVKVRKFVNGTTKKIFGAFSKDTKF